MLKPGLVIVYASRTWLSPEWAKLQASLNYRIVQTLFQQARDNICLLLFLDQAKFHVKCCWAADRQQSGTQSKCLLEMATWQGRPDIVQVCYFLMIDRLMLVRLNADLSPIRSYPSSSAPSGLINKAATNSEWLSRFSAIELAGSWHYWYNIA